MWTLEHDVALPTVVWHNDVNPLRVYGMLFKITFQSVEDSWALYVEQTFVDHLNLNGRCQHFLWRNNSNNNIHLVSVGFAHRSSRSVIVFDITIVATSANKVCNFLLQNIEVINGLWIWFERFQAYNSTIQIWSFHHLLMMFIVMNMAKPEPK